MKKHLVTAIATGLYSGFFPLYAGTFGTIPAWLIGFFLCRGDWRLLTGGAVVFTVLSIWSAGEAEKLFGHDAKKIVMDEWAGMFITLILVPLSLANYMIACFAFRAFDVLKVPPAAQFERLQGGWGVTLDDVMAGVYANIATHLVIYGWQHWA